MKRSICLILSLVMLMQWIPFNASAEMPFSDVKEGKWYYEAVNHAYSNGLMNGLSDSKFGPTDELTRAMFVTILGRIAEVNTAKYSGTSFSDVLANKWYSPYVQWASTEGIVNGYGGGLFGTNDSVTREQMATMIARYVENGNISLDVGQETVASFRDADKIAKWARDGVELMRKTGLIQGDKNGYFNPKNTATRAEAATLFMRLHQALNANQPEVSVPDGAIDLGNGDSLYTLSFENISYDPDTCLFYADDIVCAILEEGLTTAQKEEIAASVGGTIAGSISSTMDILQINVGSHTLDELIEMVNFLEFNEHVLYAYYDIITPTGMTSSSANTSARSYTTPSNSWGDTWYSFLEADYVHANYQNYLATPVQIGVIDAAMQHNHNELSGNIRLDCGPAEYICNEFMTNPDRDISMVHHGTHVAGIISAKNDGTGITGIAAGYKILFGSILGMEDSRYQEDLENQGIRLDDITFNTTTSTFHAILMQLYKGSKVINCSFGEYHYSYWKFFKERFDTIIDILFPSDQSKKSNESENEFLDTFENFIKSKENTNREYRDHITELMCLMLKDSKFSNDFIFVNSAGNGDANEGNTGVNAINSSYWAAITEDSSREILEKYGIEYSDFEKHYIIVSSIENSMIGNNYNMFTGHNYGETVEICAPGIDIYSTVYNNSYDTMSGTSMAAPMVTATAALVWSVNPELSAEKVHDIVLNNYRYMASGTYTDEIYGTKTWEYPVVNARLAVEAAIETTLPAKINYYEVIDNEANHFEAAKEYCESIGGHLATITSDQENEYVYNVMVNAGFESAYFGLTDFQNEGDWKWVNGETSLYRNWHPGEPNYENGSEDYAMFYYKYKDGKWNDGDFGGSTVNGGTAFICEWETKEAYQKYLDEKQSGESYDEAGLYTKFLLDTEYCGLIEAHYFDSYELTVETCLIDIDNDGIEEALVKISTPYYQNFTLTLDIKDGSPYMTKSAYDSGGNMGFETIELKYDQQAKRYVFVSDSYYRAFMSIAGRSITIYSDCCETVSQYLKNEGINMESPEYEGYFIYQVEEVMAATNHYQIEDGYFNYWMIGDSYVSQDDYKAASSRYTALVAGNAYSMYQGTYSQPFPSSN